MSAVIPIRQMLRFFTANSRLAYVVPDGIKAAMIVGYGQHSIQKLSTDSIGTTTVTLTNVVVGSRYRIEVAGTGALAEPTANAEGVAASSTVPITLNLYAAGNANNALRVKVRKATPGSTAYRPFETQLTLSAAAQSAFVGQIEDE